MTGDGNIERAPPKRRRRPRGTVDCYYVLNKMFGKEDFRPGQKEIVDAVVQGLDVLVVAPTGMGKSLCFQVPALAEEFGVTIVISPLLALIQNQIAALRALNLPAVALSSSCTPQQTAAIFKDLGSAHPHNRLLYMTPERFCSSEFKKIINLTAEQGQLNRLVVDEAHCISEWGHDFRKEYRKLAYLRKSYPNIPIMALTASATDTVQDDIFVNLCMDDELFAKFVRPVDRPNLFYEIRYRTENIAWQEQDILAFIGGLHRRALQRNPTMCEDLARAISGVIYCRTRKTCEELSDFLRKHGIKSAPFHRGLSQSKNDTTMERWLRADEFALQGRTRIDVICATIAFGMGIDKPNVRYVIHWDLPKSFEDYYQQTGRAGRDNLVSRCLLYYSREDTVKVGSLVQQQHTRRANRATHGFPVSQRAPNSFSKLVEYCESSEHCRHSAICEYFGQTLKPDEVDAQCGSMCDICKHPDKVKARIAVLSSHELVSTQTSRLQKEVQGYDVDDYNSDDDVGRHDSAVFPTSTQRGAGPPPLKRTRPESPPRPPPPPEPYRPPPGERRPRPDPVQHRLRQQDAGPSRAMPPPELPFAYRGSSSGRPGSAGTPPGSVAARPRRSSHKPFRTPFKATSQQADEPEPPDNYRPSSRRPSGWDRDPHMEPNPSSSPPSVDVQVQELLSRNIPLETRKQNVAVFCKHLAKVLEVGKYCIDVLGPSSAWGGLDCEHASPEERYRIVVEAAVEIEHGLIWLCMDVAAYLELCSRRISTLKHLDKHSFSTDEPEEEDVAEVVRVVRRQCRMWEARMEERAGGV